MLLPLCYETQEIKETDSKKKFFLNLVKYHLASYDIYFINILVFMCTLARR